MLVGHYNFCVPVFDFLPADRIFFSHHVVATHKHSFEESAVWKSGYSFHFFYKIWLPVILWPVLFVVELVGSFSLLPVVRNVCQLVNLWLRGLFGVQIVVLFLVENIEASGGLPGIFVVLLCLLNNFILVYFWESKRHKFFSISVKVFAVVGYRFSQLLLLEFPNVQFLRRILKSLNASWQVNTRLGQLAFAHRFQLH